ncbi:MAG: hypothetical protein ACYTBP_07705 [Planctomycetota bacterium]|jgi:hypothetical protein
MKAFIVTISGSLFIVSAGLYIFVRLRMRDSEYPDLDDYYHEFEHLHPGYAKYLKWSKITFSSVIIAILLMFLALLM